MRPGELRTARWADIDLDAGEWRFAASKTGQAHIVPLASQAVAILRDLQPLTGGGYVFPSVRGKGRPMSENTINAALRRMGFDSDTMTGHGFRAMARTVLAQEKTAWRHSDAQAKRRKDKPGTDAMGDTSRNDRIRAMHARLQSAGNRNATA
ncbi:tyrosine-type recombinase/integrase [Luteimonas sp. A277]